MKGLTFDLLVQQFHDAPASDNGATTSWKEQSPLRDKTLNWSTTVCGERMAAAGETTTHASADQLWMEPTECNSGIGDLSWPKDTHVGPRHH